jgi:hypothetical protein
MSKKVFHHLLTCIESYFLSSCKHVAEFSNGFIGDNSKINELCNNEKRLKNAINSDEIENEMEKLWSDAIMELSKQQACYWLKLVKVS